MTGQPPSCPECGSRRAIVTLRRWPVWVSHLTRGRLSHLTSWRCYGCFTRYWKED